MSISMKSTKHFGFDPTPDPLRGPKGDTDFLRSNYKYMEIGGIFRTPKAKFSVKKIQAGAKKAGFIVRVDVDGPWHKVTVTGKIKPAPRKPEKPMVYLGAGKEYPPPPRTIRIARSVEITPTLTPEPAPTPDIDIFS